MGASILHFGIPLGLAVFLAVLPRLIRWLVFHPRDRKMLAGYPLPLTPGMFITLRPTLENSIASSLAATLRTPGLIEDSATRKSIPRQLTESMPADFEKMSADPQFLAALEQGAAETIKEALLHREGQKSARDLALSGQGGTFSWEGVIRTLWGPVADGIDGLCRSEKFRASLRAALARMAEEMRKTDSGTGKQIERCAAKALEESVQSLDLEALLATRLASFPIEEIESAVHRFTDGFIRQLEYATAGIAILASLVFLLIPG